MPNVRLDANSIPKGPVYDPTPSAIHRAGVTAVDTSDPPGTAGVDTDGYEECRFDLDIGGTGLQSLEVQVLFWNPRLNAWFGGGRRLFTAPGRYALTVPVRGQRVFLKVTAFTGTSFSLSVDYTLS
ncbi:MAG: hypothetical protein NZ951_01350 [Dehalococcoidia bacterium]|nr:hypothetical protein [Dehalococcoidia bacterium]MDW8119478.1 hypothetical protein [Chloroflexota bacterium]